MSTADQRYQEKLWARAEGRAPVIVGAVAPLSAGASVDERYRAKLAARVAAKGGAPAVAPAVAPAPAEAAPATEAKGEKPEQKKADGEARQDGKGGKAPGK